MSLSVCHLSGMDAHDARSLPAKAQETLRLRVVKAVRNGMSQTEAAGVFGLARGTINGWVNRAQRQGLRALRAPRRGAAPAVALGSASGGHRRSHDPQRLSRPDELTVCPVDPRSGATTLVAEVWRGRFSVDGGTLFASLGFDAAETGTAGLRTGARGGGENGGEKIPGHSRVGAAPPGTSPLVRRDGITFGSSSGTILRTTRPNTCCLGDWAAFPLQHDLGDHQSRASGVHAFSSALHRPGLPQFSRPSVAAEPQEPEESISDSR